MDISVVCEQRFEKYVADIFRKHEKSGIKLKSFYDWDDTERKNSYGIPVTPMRGGGGGIACYDKLLLIGLNTGYLSQMMRKVYDKKMGDVYALKWFEIINKEDFILQNDLDEKKTLRINNGDGGKPILGELQVHVSDNCNLNCKACSHFTPFVKAKRQINTQVFERDLQNLQRLFSNIFIFHFMGGEPLLEPDLCIEMIRMTKSYFPDCPINIITNGVLIDRMNSSFWKFLKDNCITVRVSVYPTVIEKLESIEQTLKKWEIPFICEVDNKVEFEKKVSLFRNSNALNNMRRCHGRGCYSLVDGRISKCPDSIYFRDAINELKIHGIEPGDWGYAKDAIVLEDEYDGWDVMRRLEMPCNFCSHCDIDNRQMITWEMTKGRVDLKDWFIDFES